MSILTWFWRRQEIVEENALLVQRCHDLKIERDALLMRRDADAKWRELAREEYAALVQAHHKLTVSYEDILSLPEGMPKCESH
jgi:hypothetical protein